MNNKPCGDHGGWATHLLIFLKRRALLFLLPERRRSGLARRGFHLKILLQLLVLLLQLRVLELQSFQPGERGSGHGHARAEHLRFAVRTADGGPWLHAPAQTRAVSRNPGR